MKRLLCLHIVLLAIATSVFSQSSRPTKIKLQAQFDSIKNRDHELLLAGKLDSMPGLNRQLLQLAQKIDVDSTYMWCYDRFGNYFNARGDFAQCFEFYFKALPYAEKGIPGFVPALYENIASSYIELENYTLALFYLNKEQQSLSLNKTGESIISHSILSSIVYYKLNKPDSALKYVQQAYQLGLKRNANYNTSHAAIYKSFGNVYELLNEPELAASYYKKGLHFCDSVKLPRLAALISKYYSRYLIKQQKYADAKNYALLSFEIGKKTGFKMDVLQASDLLFKIYRQVGQEDSAYYYLKVNHLYQDSVATEQKANQLQATVISQQLKEAEQTTKAAHEKEQRRHNIQYAAIALGLVLLVMIFLLLSRSVIVNTRVIEIVGVIGLLIVFEFINLVIHPYLMLLTNDSPLLMLLILVLIAAVIVPLHHKLEEWIKHKLVEKNKAIRLEAAKRTIEKLEGK